MKIGTHHGIFHADEVFGVAALMMAHPKDQIDVVRTNDDAILGTCDFRVDTGGRNDPATGDYDHHQPGGAGSRPNGVPYASCGLVWKQFGTNVCGCAETAKLLDEILVQGIDARDCGMNLVDKYVHPEIRPLDVSDVIAGFNPTRVEPRATDDTRNSRFQLAVDCARTILQQQVYRAQEEMQATAIVRGAIAAARDPRVIVIDQACLWERTIRAEAPQALLVVTPRVNGEWSVYTIRQTPGGSGVRFRLPATWHGKKNGDLAYVSGIRKAIFCHNTGFMATARGKDGALALVQAAFAQGAE